MLQKAQKVSTDKKISLTFKMTFFTIRASGTYQKLVFLDDFLRFKIWIYKSLKINQRLLKREA